MKAMSVYNYQGFIKVEEKELKKKLVTPQLG
jgi:hypothetical protein